MIFPAGVYQVSKTLVIAQAVKIFGQGQATIDGATHIVPSSLGFDVFRIVGVNWGVVLEGFHIKAYNYMGTGGHFLRIQGCQFVVVRVLANGYNSLAAINCGALNCNRAFWSTKDGGAAPNFFVISGVGCSDHGNRAIALDDGGYTQVSGMCITSSHEDNITVGENITTLTA